MSWNPILIYAEIAMMTGVTGGLVKAGIYVSMVLMLFPGMARQTWRHTQLTKELQDWFLYLYQHLTGLIFEPSP
jgi:hypothetical protein